MNAIINNLILENYLTHGELKTGAILLELKNRHSVNMGSEALKIRAKHVLKEKGIEINI